MRLNLYIITLMFSFMLSSCEPMPAMAQSNISDSKAIHAILGEAGSSYSEKLAIAHAIRNRGHLGGVYGYLKAPTAKQWQEGSRAWNEAKNAPDTVFGANHWLSDWDLKHAKPRLTAFRFKMIETAYIGNTHFYREV